MSGCPGVRLSGKIYKPLVLQQHREAEQRLQQARQAQQALRDAVIAAGPRGAVQPELFWAAHPELQRTPPQVRCPSWYSPLIRAAAGTGCGATPGGITTTAAAATTTAGTRCGVPGAEKPPTVAARFHAADR